MVLSLSNDGVPACAWTPQDTSRGGRIGEPSSTLQMGMGNLSRRVHFHSCLHGCPSQQAVSSGQWSHWFRASDAGGNSHTEGDEEENRRSSDALLHVGLLLSQWPQSPAGCVIFISVLCLPKCLHLSFSSTPPPPPLVLPPPCFSECS